MPDRKTVWYLLCFFFPHMNKIAGKKKTSSSFNTQAQQDIVIFLTGAPSLTVCHFTAYCYCIQHTKTPPTNHRQLLTTPLLLHSVSMLYFDLFRSPTDSCNSAQLQHFQHCCLHNTIPSQPAYRHTTCYNMLCYFSLPVSFELFS